MVRFCYFLTMLDKPECALFPRREFLRKGALATGAMLFGTSCRGDPKLFIPRKIVDSHVHFYDPIANPGNNWPPADNAVLYAPHTPDQFRALTSGMGIVGVVVIEAEARPQDNQWVFNLARNEPLILGYIARLVPGNPDFAGYFAQYLKNPVFRGLRLREDDLARGLGHAGFERDVRHAGEHGLTFDLVGGPGILASALRLARITPGARLVVDHLPFPEWDDRPEAMREALKSVAALPNAYAKVSNVLRRSNGELVTDPHRYSPRLDVLWELFGDDRVVYGSNWPVSDMIGPYASVLQVVSDYVGRRGSAAGGKFFWRNSQAAYALKSL